MRNFKFFHGSENPIRLRAEWTPEVVENFGSLHNMESELTNILSNQIARQIDNDIITQLFRESNEGMRA